MTYRDLYRLLNNVFTEEQLDDQVKIHDPITNETYHIRDLHRGTGADHLYDHKTYFVADLNQGYYRPKF